MRVNQAKLIAAFRKVIAGSFDWKEKDGLWYFYQDNLLMGIISKVATKDPDKEAYQPFADEDWPIGTYDTLEKAKKALEEYEL